MPETGKLITVSVVSHRQGDLIAELLKDLVQCPTVAKIILTQNIPESEIAYPESLQSRIRLIRNDQPKGFAANHNQAFQQCETPLFAVLNPDIRLEHDPFPLLTEVLAAKDIGMAAPAVRNPHGMLEDNARHFPTPAQLFTKLLGLTDGRIDVDSLAPQVVDWTAGMFMLFKTDVFRKVGGFDEGFFLYYEDVDICVRLWQSGRPVMLHPGVWVIHAAQRASRRRLRYMAWHLSSMARYFIKHVGRLPPTHCK